MSQMPTISPERAAELVRKGAVLVDVREANEHAREHIRGARHHALSRIDRERLVRPGDEILVFYCRSGARTCTNAARLAAAAPACQVFLLDAGIDRWKKAGLPVELDRRQPIDLMRQVQIAAGGLALSGALLGLLVTPAFSIIPAFVGAGLLFAGVSGFCGMARDTGAAALEYTGRYDVVRCLPRLRPACPGCRIVALGSTAQICSPHASQIWSGNPRCCDSANRLSVHPCTNII